MIFTACHSRCECLGISRVKARVLVSVTTVYKKAVCIRGGGGTFIKSRFNILKVFNFDFELSCTRSRFPIPDPRSPIPDPRSPIPDPRSPIPDPRSPILIFQIPDPRSSILDPRSSIPDPGFPGNPEIRLLTQVTPTATSLAKSPLLEARCVYGTKATCGCANSLAADRSGKRSSVFF